MTLDINPVVICSYPRAVIVPLLKAKTSNTCEKAVLHSNIPLRVCSEINWGVVSKFHCELVVKIHEDVLLVQDFATSSLVCPGVTASEHAKAR